MDSDTSYDYSYRNSYSYISLNNVRQWNYKTSEWSYTYGYTAPTVDTSNYVYTGSDSSWYSTSLKSDGTGLRTSYDSVYRNSYSYISTENVKQWNYESSTWTYTYGYVSPSESVKSNTDSNYVYTGQDSTWYSSTLRSDGTGSVTSYDTSYRNSYSYINAGNVKQWDYTTSSWSYTYGYVSTVSNCEHDEIKNSWGSNRCREDTDCMGRRICSSTEWCTGLSGC